MPTTRIMMRQIREALRLHLQVGLTYSEVARALKLSKSAVGKYVSLARAAGVDWAVAQTLTDVELQGRLYRPPVPRASDQLAPDFAVIHQELKRPGVTLMLLWEEYARGNAQAYKYTSFCIKYRAWAQRLKRSMRQVHEAGEKLFVDYAGQTVPITDPTTGEISAAQIFVATLGASSYTYACATPRQTTADWIGAQVQALEFFGGVPRLIVPDQARALIKHPDTYDPLPNRTYEEFARHDGCALLAARPAHPRDKPKVEGAVLLVERWILARLRNRRFFSLVELNAAIAALMADLNLRPFQKLPGCRRDAFLLLDAPALSPLPPTRYAVGRWKQAKVNVDYHVEFEGHYYSVPHRLVGATVEMRAGAGLLEIFHANQRVACHALNARRGQHSTTPEHMPASHRAHLEWTPAKLIAWGQRIGGATAGVVAWQLENRPHPEQGYRACLGLKRLAREYTPARLEAACARALAIRSPTYRSVASILKSGLDRQHAYPPTTASTALPEHENVRGADYYH
ncbi:IS21 family transposase [Thiomonas sp. Bio17B3]|uniref:IS21 family transposase n=1 Tax=Thiomonas sp. Bio17B3 TaxID=2493108 RepID=UPI0012DFD691|nr:IS21 family transposase [Thiomonas sp. Bio17B3]